MSTFSCFFGNPTNKTETGTPYTWDTTNSKPPWPIIVMDQSEILNRSQVQFITLLLGGAQLCCAFYQPRKQHEFGAEKSISWDKPAHFDFFTINFTVWSHILSTVGNARTTLLFAAARIPGTYYSTCSLLIGFILANHWQIFFSVPGGQMIKWNLFSANVLLKKY